MPKKVQKDKSWPDSLKIIAGEFSWLMKHNKKGTLVFFGLLILCFLGAQQVGVIDWAVSTIFGRREAPVRLARPADSTGARFSLVPMVYAQESDGMVKIHGMYFGRPDPSYEIYVMLPDKSHSKNWILAFDKEQGLTLEADATWLDREETKQLKK